MQSDCWECRKNITSWHFTPSSPHHVNTDILCTLLSHSDRDRDRAPGNFVFSFCRVAAMAIEEEKRKCTYLTLPDICRRLQHWIHIRFHFHNTYCCIYMYMCIRMYMYQTMWWGVSCLTAAGTSWISNVEYEAISVEKSHHGF